MSHLSLQLNKEKKDKLQKKWENICSFSKKTKRECIYGKVYTLTHLKKKKSNHQTDMLNNDKENPKKKGGGGHMLEQNFKFLNFWQKQKFYSA